MSSARVGRARRGLPGVYVARSARGNRRPGPGGFVCPRTPPGPGRPHQNSDDLR